jgi:serine/threonine protein phosphatase PrpC
VAESRLVCDLLADALAAAEAALLAASGINCTLSGSTASVLLLRAGAVHLVNVGDSRVVLAGLAAGSAGGPRDH